MFGWGNHLATVCLLVAVDRENECPLILIQTMSIFVYFVVVKFPRHIKIQYICWKCKFQYSFSSFLLFKMKRRKLVYHIWVEIEESKF